MEVTAEQPYVESSQTYTGQSVRLGTPLKCLYTGVCSMGSEQEELEVYVGLQGYNRVGLTKMWWDGWHDWDTVMKEYRLFKDRQGRQGWQDALYVCE